MNFTSLLKRGGGGASAFHRKLQTYRLNLQRFVLLEGPANTQSSCVHHEQEARKIKKMKNVGSNSEYPSLLIGSYHLLIVNLTYCKNLG